MHHDTFGIGLNDRLRFNGEFYRLERRDKPRKLWILRRIAGGSALDDQRWQLTDREHYKLRRSASILVDAEYFSLAGRLLAGRNDDSDISDLTEDQQLTIAWKVEWCTRFYRARALLDGYRTAPACSPEGLADFVLAERDRVHRWYVNTFRKPRPVGRPGIDGERKVFDWPGGSTLRDWMRDYEAEDYKKKAFRPEYGNCGNRNQLNGLVVDIIEQQVRKFAGRGKLAICDIYDKVDDKIELLNRGRPANDALSVSETAVRRRVRKLEPGLVYAGRLGTEIANRKYMPIGQGLETITGLGRIERMDRVEMDCHEMDLFVLLNAKQMRARLGPDARLKAAELDPSVRCTITWCFDVATRCIVGLNVTPSAPSCAGTRGALHTMLVDKTGMAKAAKASRGWTMFAKPGEVVSDGGPAYRGEFHDTLRRLGIDHRYAGGDPRRRGHVEASFRLVKAFCRMFTGQAFSNVVERGDYESSRCASLFAVDLEALLVRFIVDYYHQKKHRELGGARPQTAWEKAGNTLTAAPDPEQRKIAFGIRLDDRTIDAAGVTFLHIEYKHPKMALLHASVGNKRLAAIVDPRDLGQILVRIPDEAKRHFDKSGAYVAFTARQEFRHVPILRHLNNCAALRAMERKESAAGRPFRLDALRDMESASEKARKKAGVEPDMLSAERYRKLFAEFERGGQLAMAPRAAPAGPAMDEEGEPDVLGTLVVRPAGSIRVIRHKAPGTPATRSINRFTEDDE